MKKILYKNITFMRHFTGIVLSSFTKTTPMDVKVVNERILKKNNKVTIDLEFVVDNVTVRSNEMVIYTPVIVSPINSFDRVELPSVLLTGNKRSKIVERQQQLNKQISVVADPMAIVKKEKHSQKPIKYSIAIAYSDWMQGATLSVETAVSGCADCYEQTDDLFVATNIIAQKKVPTFTLVDSISML